MGIKAFLAISLFAVLLMGVISFDDAFAVEERFDNLGPTFTTSELVKPDFKVTGSNTINVIQFNGLAIIGGNCGGIPGDVLIDPLESITVTFNLNPATNIDIFVNPLGRGDIHAFDANGISLGTQLSGGGGGNISQLFGNVPISKFTFVGHDEDFACPGGRLVSINYDLAPLPPTNIELILIEVQQINQQLITGLTDIGNSLTSIQNQLLAILGLLEDPTERVSVTIQIDKFVFKSGELVVLLDVTHSGTLANVHVAANLPCDNAGEPELKIVAGEADGVLVSVISTSAENTGLLGPAGTCVFHGDVDTAIVSLITDVILTNNGLSRAVADNVIVTVTGTYE